MSMEPPEDGARAKISSSGHGQAYLAMRDMAHQSIEIRDSHVTIIETRAEKANDREQEAQELLGAIDGLKARLAQMTVAAQAIEDHLRREVGRAREEGRAQAIAESQARLRDAERKRREVEARLSRVEDERDQAVQLMREAQIQAINARNELEEARRTARLEANLQAVREHMEQAAESGALSRDEPYQDLIAVTDAELDNLSTRLATLSTELDDAAQRPRPADDTVPALPPASPREDQRADPWLSTTSKAGEQTAGWSPLPEAESEPQRRVKLPTPPVSPQSSGGAKLLALVLAIVVGALYTADGISVKNMITAPVGPAIGWQVLYAVASLSILTVIAFVVGAAFFIHDGPGPEVSPASNTYVIAFILGFVVFLIALVFNLRSVPVIGPLGDWLVHHLGPM